MLDKSYNSLISNKNFQILLVVSFSILHGFLYFYPDWIQNLSVDESTAYFSFHHGKYYANSDEITYGPSIRRIFDFFDYGFLNLYNPTSFNADSSINFQILPYIFAGFLSYILGSVENFFYLKNFIFPTIGYLITFILLKTFFRSFFLCLFGAILLYNPYFAIIDIYSYFTFDSTLWNSKYELSLLATKYPSQQFTLLFYFLGLISLYKILENKNYKYLLIFSITFSAYSYVYTFVGLALMTLCLFLYSWTKSLKCKKDLFIAGLISFLLSLPVILISATQAFREDMLMAFYFTQTQVFSPTGYLIKSIIASILCLLIIKFYRKSYSNLSAIIITQFLPLIIFSYLCYYLLILPESQHFIWNYHFSKVLFILMVVNIILNLNGKPLIKFFKNFVFISFCLTSILLFLNTMNWNVQHAKLKTDLWPSEYKKILNWISLETPKKSTILSIDPLLISTIPTLSGRYNYIPSLKTLTPTSINSPILALANAKKILGLSDKFDQFINSSCGANNTEGDPADLKLFIICNNFFYAYFDLDKGSFSYLIRSKSIPEDLIIPEKSRKGDRIRYTVINFENFKETHDKNFPLPEYIIIGPTEKQFINKENYSDLYQEVFSTENYQIFEIKN